MIQRVLSKVARLIKRKVNRKKYMDAMMEEFPSSWRGLLISSYDNYLCRSERNIVSKVEEIRERTRTENANQVVETFASPPSGTDLHDSDGTIIPGKINKSANAGFARTGTKGFEGIQLLQLAETIGAKSILELGTNTGLSAYYLLSSKYKPTLVTIEGSSQLCQIAQENIRNFSPRFEIVNKLFDDALTDLVKSNQKFDMAFIDGQHEEQATIYYANKIKQLMNPGGIILFDDIFWSEGMSRAWDKIKEDDEFESVIGLRTRGIAVLRSNDSESQILPRYFEVTDYIGKTDIYRKGY